MSRSTTRRSRLVVGAALAGVSALTLAGCAGSTDQAAGAGSGDAELTTIRVSLGWITNVEWAGFWIADQNGYFAEEGLDIEWIGGGPNAPTTMASVAAGDADLGIQPSAQGWLQSFADGNDWTAIGSLFQDSPASLVSLASDPVHTAEDMKGKTVLGQEGGQIDYDAIFALAGLEPDYEFIPVGFDPAPLVEEQGVAYTAYSTNQPIMLETTYGMSADDFVVTMYSDLGLPLYGNVIYGDSAYIEDNGDLMEGFLRASLRGWEENGEDPSVGAQLAVDVFGADLGLDIEQQTRENELQQPLVVGSYGDPLFWMDTELMTDLMYPGLEAAGYSDLPAPEDYVDMSYLEAALATVAE